MNSQDFSQLVEQQISECEEVLRTKGADYSDAERDRLSNFKLIATMFEMMGLKADLSNPASSWAIYFMKHIIALLKGMLGGRLESEPLAGRFTDAHNYLFLGRALNEEHSQLGDDLTEAIQQAKKYLYDNHENQIAE